jgi:hypothetical protein
MNLPINNKIVVRNDTNASENEHDVNTADMHKLTTNATGLIMCC